MCLRSVLIYSACVGEIKLFEYLRLTVAVFFRIPVPVFFGSLLLDLTHNITVKVLRKKNHPHYYIRYYPWYRSASNDCSAINIFSKFGSSVHATSVAWLYRHDSFCMALHIILKVSSWRPGRHHDGVTELIRCNLHFNPCCIK